MQELNGLDMGRILHSTNACIYIVNHIGEEMRKLLIKEIIESESRFSIIIDESTTISQKSVLIVYFRTFLESMGNEVPMNIFVDLIELDSVTASGIFGSLMSHLGALGFSEEFLKDHLVSLTCDGAAVMLGSRGGVAALFKEKFPEIIVWHCASHRLELSVNDAVRDTGTVNRFKAFLDKLYAIYHASPKNARELSVCASFLETQLLRIGRVLSTRWVSSSYNTVFAVWQNYEALVSHFEVARVDKSRDKKEQCMYDGLHRKITSTNFVLDLGLMLDALQELSELSLDLQERNMDMYKANIKIESLVKVFEKRKKIPGTAYKQAQQAVQNLKFCGVSLHQKVKAGDPPISPTAFYNSLKQSVEKRLLSKEDAELSRYAQVLDEKKWPAEAKNNILFGEDQVRYLSQKFRLSERETIRAFRDFLQSPEEIPEKITRLQHMLHTVAISSSECERGFSQLNLIVTPQRSSLLIDTTRNLLFIRIVGPPLTNFNPDKYVNTWLLKGRRAATDTRCKERDREEKNAKEMAILWKIF